MMEKLSHKVTNIWSISSRFLRGNEMERKNENGSERLAKKKRKYAGGAAKQ